MSSEILATSTAGITAVAVVVEAGVVEEVGQCPTKTTKTETGIMAVVATEEEGEVGHSA